MTFIPVCLFVLTNLWFPIQTLTLRLGQMCFIVPVITQYKTVSYFKQKYSSDEIDAAYALLALSSSAPAPPPCYKTVKPVKPGANASSTATDDKQLPCASQTTYQSTPQMHSCQVSPLAELNSFVAVAIPNGNEKCPFKNEMYSTSHPVSLLFVFTKPTYTVFRASRGVSKLEEKIQTFKPFFLHSDA